MDYNKYILSKVNKYFLEIVNDEHHKMDKSHKYYMMDLKLFIGMMDRVKENGFDLVGKKFLEIGSGTGYCCDLMRREGMQAEGIELNSKLVEISTQMFSEIKFHNIDCLDFENYGDYDIIYYYCPFKDKELQKKLNTKIEDEIKVGGYIVRDMLGEEKNYKDYRFTNVDNNKFHNKIWLKIKK